MQLLLIPECGALRFARLIVKGAAPE